MIRTVHVFNYRLQASIQESPVTDVVSDQNVGETDVSRLPLTNTSADRAGRTATANTINVKTGTSTGNRPNSLTE